MRAVQLGDSWLKRITLDSELDRLFLISTFSLNVLFPALDRNTVLIYASKRDEANL